MKLARIHFAANDDRGHFTGQARAIEIEFPDDDKIEIAIETRVARFKDSIRVGGRQGVRVRCYGWQEWVGNMCWDATSVSVEDAKAILRWLLSQRYACVESYTCGSAVEEMVSRSPEGRR